jgi:hypothetical protein
MFQAMNQAMLRTSIIEWLSRLVGRAGEIGPYLAIELILPGGSLVALLLWLYRRTNRGV